MAFVALFWLLPAAVALTACALGHYRGRGRRGWLSPAFLALLAVVTLALAGVALSGRDADVSGVDVAVGVALAAVGLGALPLIAFYTLGYALRYAWAVAMVWVVGSIALGFYMFLGAVIVADYVACPPDAYECPL